MSDQQDLLDPAILASITETTLISRSPSVLASDVKGAVLMMNINMGRYFGLDDIGSDIWRRLDKPCPFAVLIDKLVADYDADRATIAEHVRVLLARMAQSDAIRLG